MANEDKESITEWLRYADMDLATAQNLLQTMHPAPLEIICYHCQQASEKYLKALMIHFGVEILKTHSLPTLVAVLSDFLEIPVFIDESAENLTQFATKTRYPQAFSVDETQTQKALFQAQKVKGWAEEVLQQK